jgi:hypothetical protein
LEKNEWLSAARNARPTGDNKIVSGKEVHFVQPRVGLDDEEEAFSTALAVKPGPCLLKQPADCFRASSLLLRYSQELLTRRAKLSVSTMMTYVSAPPMEQ